MDINLNYLHDETRGYGRLGVKLGQELAKRGVTVYDHMPPAEGVFDGDASGRTSGLSGTACWVSVPTHARGWWSSQSPVMFTMWETMHLPECFRENLHHFDQILVPSAQNVDLFSTYHPNVKQVLLGVDPEEWHYVERPLPEVFFDFLIGGSGARKGTDLAYKAFLKAFPTVGDGPIPRLVMKNPKGESFDHDRVMVIAGTLEPADEQALYGSAHCYLQPSRGEGFGLQPLQAMAQGIPTILTGAHGHESFAHLAHGISAKPAQSAYFIYGEAGDWWEPDLDELVDRMRWVYDNWGLAVEKARVGASVIAQDFTWSNTVDQFLDAVDLARPFEKGDWFTPTPLQFRLRVDQDMVVNVGDTTYQFQAGVDYWTPGDVKRVLAEGGHLSADCVSDQEGLTLDQVERLKGDHLYCTSCHQRYGSGLTKADDLYLEGEAARA